jgi:uncharacterized protein YcnI
MRSYISTGFRRSAALSSATLLSILALAVPASAHVTIDPGTATAGGSDLQLTFRVPDEEANANTVKLEITFPTDHPIASVLVSPIAGWTSQVENTTLPTPIHTDDGDISQVVSKVTWSGGQIAPGQYQGFPVMLGLLPSGVNQVVFKAVQTSSNGDIVRWIDLSQAGQPAPDHPATVLRLNPDTSKSGPSPSAPATPSVTVSATVPTTPAAKSSDSTARTLAGAGLAVAVVAALGAGVAIARAGRRSRPSGGSEE